MLGRKGIFGGRGKGGWIDGGRWLEFPVHKTKGNFTKQECMYNAI